MVCYVLVVLCFITLDRFVIMQVMGEYFIILLVEHLEGGGGGNAGDVNNFTILHLWLVLVITVFI